MGALHVTVIFLTCCCCCCLNADSARRRVTSDQEGSIASTDCSERVCAALCVEVINDVLIAKKVFAYGEHHSHTPDSHGAAVDCLLPGRRSVPGSRLCQPVGRQPQSTEQVSGRRADSLSALHAYMQRL